MKILSLLLLTVIATAFAIKQPPPSYNITASQEFVHYAAAAFCDDRCIPDWNCKITEKYPLTDILYIDHPVSKIHGYVGYRPTNNQIIAAFRGTDGWRNWIEDANFEKVDFPDCLDCEVHAGFYAAFMSV